MGVRLHTYLSTARYLDSIHWPGDLNGLDQPIFTALVTHILHNLLVLLVIQQLLRQHHVHEAQDLSWVAAHLHLGAHQARHLQGHRCLVYGALWGKRAEVSLGHPPSDATPRRPCPAQGPRKPRAELRKGSQPHPFPPPNPPSQWKMTCRGAHQRGILGSHTCPLDQQFLVSQLHPVQPCDGLHLEDNEGGGRRGRGAGQGPGA